MIAQTDVTIRGPGLIQRFRNSGIFVGGSTGVTVRDVTTSTNCDAGILVGGGSNHNISGNTSIRNGSRTLACGGI